MKQNPAFFVVACWSLENVFFAHDHSDELLRQGHMTWGKEEHPFPNLLLLPYINWEPGGLGLKEGGMREDLNSHFTGDFQTARKYLILLRNSSWYFHTTVSIVVKVTTKVFGEGNMGIILAQNVYKVYGFTLLHLSKENEWLPGTDGGRCMFLIWIFALVRLSEHQLFFGFRLQRPSCFDLLSNK